MLLEEALLGSVFANCLLMKFTATGLLAAHADVIRKVTRHREFSDFFFPHSTPSQEPTVYLTEESKLSSCVMPISQQWPLSSLLKAEG